MLCLKFEFAKAITKRLTVFAIFSLTFCHAIFLLIAKGERFQHLRDSLEMKRIQQPWKTIRSALNQARI